MSMHIEALFLVINSRISDCQFVTCVCVHVLHLKLKGEDSVSRGVNFRSSFSFFSSGVFSCSYCIQPFTVILNFLKTVEYPYLCHLLCKELSLLSLCSSLVCFSRSRSVLSSMVRRWLMCHMTTHIIPDLMSNCVIVFELWIRKWDVFVKRKKRQINRLTLNSRRSLLFLWNRHGQPMTMDFSESYRERLHEKCPAAKSGRWSLGLSTRRHYDSTITWIPSTVICKL